MNFKIKRNPLTYGEITFKGTLQLFKELDVKKGDLFCDIGSGYGKLTVAYEQYFNNKAYGIEISEEKYNTAKNIWKIHNSKYEFIHGDYKDHFNILNKCKFIYCNGICFPEEIINPLFEYMAKRKTPGVLIHNNHLGRSSAKIPLSVDWGSGESIYYKLITN